MSSRVTADGVARISSGKKTLVCNALQQVVYSIKHVMTPEIVKTGYRRIGQYPVSFLTTMGRCKRQISARDMDHMEENLANMVDIFRTTGKVTEAQLDAALILSVNDEATNGRPKDDRPLHQQRSVIMNSEDCIAQYQAQLDRRMAEPARRAEAAVQRDARKIVREERLEEARLRKEVKEAEKLRRLNLTPAELKAENKVKRAANKLAKQAAAAGLVERLPHAEANPAINDDDESADEDNNLFNDDEIDDITGAARIAAI